jgi:hypothetical protein
MYNIYYTQEVTQLPKRVKKEGDFDKASVKVSTKKILKQITENEGLFEYELIDNLLKEKYPNYYKKE